MARNKVMKLWTAIVTAFLALCTALGFVTTTAAAAVPQAEQKRNSALIPQQRTAPATAAPWSLSYAKALPPTMKQRIRAEAHGKSPSCRHRPLADTTASPTSDCTGDDTDTDADGDGDPADHLTPLQR
ncbi:DUF6344 domain-containing protein [Streptomyces afghaniensis]|uniref:DUF6344 domain-containing protein n=1 Tax=Streptomyces afghaniensis TaxID=66865 RepID=UPI00277EB217|nr:DUF6344 domain-containing protein [Streptomyces afghaniensis]MDQ1017889.1 hypothetical protein [Streptomyces afghaniensis]